MHQVDFMQCLVFVIGTLSELTVVSHICILASSYDLILGLACDACTKMC